MPDLAAEAAAIARAIGLPHSTRAIEEMASARPGPALAVLELAGVPRAVWEALPPAGRANTGDPPELAAAFLALNRTGKPKAELKRLKAAMIAEAPGRE